MDYPYSHPKGAEINEIKGKIDICFTGIKKAEEDCREDYKRGLEAFKEMGENMRFRDEQLKELASLMEKLEGVITGPLI